MRNRLLITSPAVERLKKRARKLKKEGNLTHSEALDKIANQTHCSHWNQLTQEQKATELIESAYRSGVIIAMDVKDAGSFEDESGGFVKDNSALFYCQEDIRNDYINSPDEEDDIPLREQYSEEQINEFVEDELRNYVFFRYTKTPIPEKVEDVVKMAMK